MVWHIDEQSGAAERDLLSQQDLKSKILALMDYLNQKYQAFKWRYQGKRFLRNHIPSLI